MPGEKLLLRFKFHNDRSSPCNYILDEDQAISLPQGWLKRPQPVVNIDPNSDGELYCLITAPPNAAPGDYTFRLYKGPQHDANSQEALTLRLHIIGTPAVKLAAERNPLTIGPFASAVTFTLGVASAGNTETAFRISAVRPLDNEQGEEELRPVYDSGNWSYYFDREVDNLQAPQQGRPPQPCAVRLQVLRRGRWWWGLWETHNVTVAAGTGHGCTERRQKGEPTSAHRPALAPVALSVYHSCVAGFVADADCL